MKNIVLYNSKEDVIELIRSFKKKNGLIPQRRDFSRAQCLIINKLFGSFSNAVKSAGFKPRRVSEATREELISSLKEYYKLNGKAPSVGTKSELLYNFKTYYKVLNCSGWSDVLELAGLPVYITTRKHLPTNPEEIISYAKKLIEEEGIKSMNVLFRHKLFYGIDRIKTLFGDESNFVELVGIKVNDYNVPFEEIKEKVLDVFHELNRTPSLSEISKRGISEQYLRRKFGSYNELLNRIGLTPYSEKPKICDLSNAELIEIYKEVSAKNGFENGCGTRALKELSGTGADVFLSRFSSINCLRKICGYKIQTLNLATWNYKSIEGLFRKKTSQYGKRITLSIVDKDADFPSATTIRRYLPCSYHEFTQRIYDEEKAAQ